MLISLLVDDGRRLEYVDEKSKFMEINDNRFLSKSRYEDCIFLLINMQPKSFHSLFLFQMLNWLKYPRLWKKKGSSLSERYSVTLCSI